MPNSADDESGEPRPFHSQDRAGIGSAGGSTAVGADAWGFNPDEDLPDEAYQGRRRATRRATKLSRVLVPVLGLLLVAAGVSYALKSARGGAPKVLGDPDVAAPPTTAATEFPNAATSAPVTNSPLAPSPSVVGPTPSSPPSASSTPSIVVTTVEAEDAANVLSGSAVIATESAASGGALVRGLGKRGPTAGAVEFTNVVVAAAGQYALTLYYMGKNDYLADIQVNGGSPISIAARAQRNCCSSVSLTVGLNAGVNTIAIGNAAASCPDIDRIVISIPA